VSNGLVPRDAQSADSVAEIYALARVANESLAKATSIDEAQHVLAFASTLEHVVRVKDMADMAAVTASTLRVRAERRVGEMIQAERAAGTLATRADGPRLRDLRGSTAEIPATLADHRIAHDQAQEFVKLAGVPADQFEAAVAEQVAEGRPVTRKGVLRAVAPEVAKSPPERWLDGDRFVEACKRALALAEPAVAAMRFGQYPTSDDAAAVRSSAERVLTDLRHQIDVCLRAMGG
jgi:hypothetical protein